MTRSLPVVCAVLLAFSTIARAATLTVGPGKKFAMPSQAIKAAKDGDTVEIDTAGKYDRWVWNLARITEDMIFNAKASARPTEKTPKDEPLALEKRAFAEALKTMPKK